MKGLGTDEEKINKQLGLVKTQKHWGEVQAAFKAGEKSSQFEGGDLRKALQSELDDGDLWSAMAVLWGTASGEHSQPDVCYHSVVGDTTARLYFAMKGLGTSEDDIFAALHWVRTDEQWQAVQAQFASKDNFVKSSSFHDGNLKDALYSELNAYDLKKARARLRRNNVHYEDKQHRVALPGDIIELLKLKELPDGVPATVVDDEVYVPYDANCAAQEVDLVVWIAKARIGDEELELPMEFMVNATMYAAPGIVVIGDHATLAGKKLDLPAKLFSVQHLLKTVGDHVESAADTVAEHLGKKKCKQVSDYFERKQEDVDEALRSKKILRFVVTWTYSVAGTIVTATTGDDKPYHAIIRLWLEGGTIMWGDRSDGGVVWQVKTGKEPSEEDSKNAFFEGLTEQHALWEDGKEGEGEKANLAEYGDDGKAAIIMVDVSFSESDDAKPHLEQATALADEVPSYKDYCPAGERTPFAKPLTVHWAPPTLSQLLCGLYQFAEVSYGPPTYFESYHPRKMNCQAFVFDAVCILLTPSLRHSRLGSVTCWFPRADNSAPPSLDNLETAVLIKKLKVHIVQDADRMLNSGGDCKLGEFAQCVADWIMF